MMRSVDLKGVRVLLWKNGRGLLKGCYNSVIEILIRGLLEWRLEFLLHFVLEWDSSVIRVCIYVFISWRCDFEEVYNFFLLKRLGNGFNRFWVGCNSVIGRLLQNLLEVVFRFCYRFLKVVRIEEFQLFDWGSLKGDWRMGFCKDCFWRVEMKRSKSFGPRLCSVRLLQGFVLLMREVSEGLKFG